jgi:uncharacterized membrane protein
MLDVLVLIIIIGLYFIPFIIALIRGIKNSMSVFFLNLFLGWTVIGFFVLIFYASLTNAKSSKSVGEFISEKKKKKKNKRFKGRSVTSRHQNDFVLTFKKFKSLI